MRTLITNVRLGGVGEETSIACEDGVIAEIGGVGRDDDEVIDGDGAIALPGAVDVHVHFRTPGQEKKEGWETGSRAALSGGVTTVCDMPNTIPPVTTRAAVEKKLGDIGAHDPKVRWAVYIGATNDNLGEVLASESLVCGVKVYCAPSNGGIVLDDAVALRALLSCGFSKPIVVHAEDSALIAVGAQQSEGQKDCVHEMVRPKEAAVAAVSRVLEAAVGTKAKLHITHISSSEELDLIMQAKRDGIDVTCDVTPHHLFLSRHTPPSPYFWKVMPPIRRGQAEKLWRRLIDGDIDMIASDHAPHPRPEKEHLNYWDVPSGVPGVETLLPLMLDHVGDDLDWARLVAMTAGVPARRFGFSDRGSLELGKLGDIVLVDTRREWMLRSQDVQSKCGWNPWEGKTFHQKITKVFIGGRCVFSR